jgi:hypothetical protein
MLAALSVALDDPIEQFRRFYYTTSGHLHHTE